MRIIVIGATGIIGREVVKLLEPDYDIVNVGNRRGDYHVDIGSKTSIRNLYRAVGNFDAVVSTAGLAKFGTIEELGDDDYALGLKNKLMGQVNLVRVGIDYIHDNGSFTLSSGAMSHKPMPGSTSISMVNAALEGFVRAAALEMPRGLRINVVSPLFAKETMELMGMNSASGIPAAKFAPAYKEAVEGTRNGETLNVMDFA